MRPLHLDMPGQHVEREVVVGEEDLPLVSSPAASSPRCSAAAGSASFLRLFVWTISIGGFLFGFDTGVISGALPYIRDDLLQKYAGDLAALAHWQEVGLCCG